MLSFQAKEVPLGLSYFSVQRQEVRLGQLLLCSLSVQGSYLSVQGQEPSLWLSDLSVQEVSLGLRYFSAQLL